MRFSDQLSNNLDKFKSVAVNDGMVATLTKP